MYKPLDYKWSGRVDGNKGNQLRWHQVVEYIDLERVKETQEGICIIGFKSDEGVRRNKGRPGARHAPDEIRKQLFSLPWHFENIHLYDAGDVECGGDLELAQEELEDLVSIMHSKKLFPIVIGGGHEVAYPAIMGFYKHEKNFAAIINFDAHFDMRDYSNGPTSGTSFRQIGDFCKNSGLKFKYMCVGVQRSANTQELFDVAKNYGADWIDIEMIRFNSRRALRELDEFLSDADSIHLTICSDVFAQYLAIGVSAPQPFGLQITEFLNLFYPVVNSGKLVSFDIAEVSPPLDVNGLTSSLAARVIFKVVEALFLTRFKKPFQGGGHEV